MTLKVTQSQAKATRRPASKAAVKIGPTLSVGSRGAAVRDLQAKLKRHGFNPGAIDGVFGPKTRAAVIAFQRKHHLLVDGIVGRQTWAHLGGRSAAKAGGSSFHRARRTGAAGKPAAKGSVAKLLKIAMRQVGTLESGKNAGAITKYTGGKKGWPWCAKFVSWCYRQAGMKLPGGDRWAVADIKAIVKRLGHWKGPSHLKPGMICTFRKRSHIEIIAKPVHRNGRLVGYMTIGGNTSIPGRGREGVAYKFRSLSELAGGGYPVKSL